MDSEIQDKLAQLNEEVGEILEGGYIDQYEEYIYKETMWTMFEISEWIEKWFMYFLYSWFRWPSKRSERR